MRALAPGLSVIAAPVALQARGCAPLDCTACHDEGEDLRLATANAPQLTGLPAVVLPIGCAASATACSCIIRCRPRPRCRTMCQPPTPRRRRATCVGRFMPRQRKRAKPVSQLRPRTMAHREMRGRALARRSATVWTTAGEERTRLSRSLAPKRAAIGNSGTVTRFCCGVPRVSGRAGPSCPRRGGN